MTNNEFTAKTVSSAFRYADSVRIIEAGDKFVVVWSTPYTTRETRWENLSLAEDFARMKRSNLRRTYDK